MGAEDALLCTNVVLTTVEPLEKTAHVETIYPTWFDILSMDSFMPTFFAYRLPDSSDAVYGEAVSRIKEGLRKVLVPFFPWAGRWIAVPGGGRELLCNDEGIPFIEAFVDRNLNSVVGIFTDFKAIPGLQGYSVLGMDPIHFRQPMKPEGQPCAFVQVTRFKCGGLVVAATFNHMFTDAQSFYHFMAAWADVSLTNKTSRTMDPNRKAIDPGQSTLPPDGISARAQPKSWETKCYEVSASVIESLKKEVKQRGDGAYVSTLDCIFANHWKALSSIPDLTSSGQEIGMIMVVEGRTRFYDPPLVNLLANVCVPMAAPDIPSAELVKMPVSAIASKVREKISKTSREAWLSPERTAESMELFKTDKFLTFGMSSLKSFPVYDIDFGFGTPFVAGLNANFELSFGGSTWILPPTPGVPSSAALMLIRSTPQVLDALELQPDFLSFFIPKDTKKTFT